FQLLPASLPPTNALPQKPSFSPPPACFGLYWYPMPPAMTAAPALAYHFLPAATCINPVIYAFSLQHLLVVRLLMACQKINSGLLTYVFPHRFPFQSYKLIS